MLELLLHWTVQIYDTDCYGVMWHGSYAKWLEQARVDWLRHHGVDLSQPPYDPVTGECLFPVVTQEFRFKAPARFGDALTLRTTARLEGRCRIVFDQRVTKAASDNGTQTTTLETTTVCTVVDARWRPLRHLPPTIARIFEGQTALQSL